MDSGSSQQNLNSEEGEQANGKDTQNKPELKAEWTVHAQLIISRPAGIIAKGSKPGDGPVEVVYKWSSENPKNDDEGSTPKFGSFRNINETSKRTEHHPGHDSFHSTTGGTGKVPSESGFSSSNASRKPNTPGSGTPYGTRCRSTCNIVLSAVADFIPPNQPTIPEETDPFSYNTTTTYTVLADPDISDQTTRQPSFSQNFATAKLLDLRDAFCQTSDTELRLPLSPKAPSNSTIDTSVTTSSSTRKKRKPYDYRRNTESLLSPPQPDEGLKHLPSFSQKAPSSTDASFLKDNAKKSPRTVHIDVYCTGSDAEDENDNDNDERDDSSSKSLLSENPNELESNSTPQTVLDIEQMLLRHQRVSGPELPRRYQNIQKLMHQQPKQQTPIPQILPPPTPQSRLLSPTDINGQHAGLTQQNIAKSSTADEISESKQILFRKHIGDHRNNKTNYRHRNIRKDQSDDNLSSNYPNSSRSTVRDMTWSSISSAVASNSAIYEDAETSWKETEPDLTGNASLAPSDSFEYDNSIDRLRIQKMEHLWSLPEKDAQQSGDDQNTTIDKFFHSYQMPSEDNTRDTSSKYAHGYFWPECDSFPETDYSSPLAHSYGDKDQGKYSSISPPNLQQYLNSRKSEPRMLAPTPQTEDSTPRQRFTPGRLTIPVIIRQKELTPFTFKPTRVLFDSSFSQRDDDRSSASTLQSNLSGYTNEYLAKARKFGAVVTALRKPGHHVGPAKNPECQCEHCRRWMEERDGVSGSNVVGRGRAYSTGDAPTFKTSDFWLKRNAQN